MLRDMRLASTNCHGAMGYWHGSRRSRKAHRSLAGEITPNKPASGERSCRAGEPGFSRFNSYRRLDGSYTLPPVEPRLRAAPHPRPDVEAGLRWDKRRIEGQCTSHVISSWGSDEGVSRYNRDIIRATRGSARLEDGRRMDEGV